MSKQSSADIPINENDIKFIQNLYEKYKRLFFQQILFLNLSQDDMEDIIQETVLHLINKVKTLRSLSERQQVTYIISTVKNVGINYRAKYQKTNVVSLNEITDGDEYETFISDDVTERILAEEQMAELDRALQKVDNDSRELLVMYYFMNENVEAIAERFSISPGSVRMKLTRARRKLKAAMELSREDNNHQNKSE